MIIGIGVDLVQVHRMERWRTNPRLLERFFHPDELAIALSRGGGVNQSLAARFAAKEAFGKALGIGLVGLALKDIQVVSHPNGRPELAVSGTALRAFKESGANRIHLSLTHERDNAIALVVMERLECES
ncbi:MAG: holo-ACP synthase [Treponema sp.]|jgi:holo-[acyl-carrier protein] synthase|nr:holo-ACP synthase [Treponema sp.]